MKDFSDDQPGDDDDSQVTPPGSQTRPTSPLQPELPGASGMRRRIPADDLPRAYDRPALPRQSRSQPRIEPPPPPPGVTRVSPQATPPATPPIYTPPRDRRGRREKRPRPPATPANKRDSGLYLPWWSLVIMLVFVGCAAIGALLVAGSIGGNVAPGGQTPMIIVITSTFTVGPPASQTPIPQPATLTPTAPLPTIPPTASLPPGNFAIGEMVQVVGVDTSGLNVRSAPGTASTVKFRANEGDRFVLRDGPQTASNDEWWYIQDAQDSNRAGWASRRYLTAIAPATP